MSQAATSIVGVLELDEVLKRLVVSARQATSARYGALGVIGGDGTLTNFVHDGMRDDTVRAIGNPPQGRGVLGVLIEDPRPLRLERVADHPDAVGFPPHHPTMQSFLGVPVRSGDEVYGNLYLAEADEGFTELDEMLAISLASIAGAAIVAARMHDGVELFAVAEDRSRIGRELHDTIVQQMFAIGVEIQATAAMSDATVAARLRSTVTKVDKAIDDLRHIVADFHPLDGHELAPPLMIIQDAVNDLSDAHSFPVGLTVKPANMRLRPELVDNLRSFVVEAVSNALRHAKGDSVDVEIDLSENVLTVTIADDGVGFDPTTIDRGHGLNDLEERAKKMGGRLMVSSQAKVGTAVALKVPASIRAT